MTAKTTAKATRKFFGHPLGLLNLFSTELCERFSYYGMRAILVYYLYATLADGGLGLSETDAMIIMSLFGSLVFLSSIIGGWLSDRVLGSYKSVLVGGVIIAAGHILLGFPFGIGGTTIALACIVLGTGLLKPNVSVMVGELYTKDDPRRQGGFSLLYMSINIGSFISPLIVGFVAESIGYHIAFTIPAALMVVGIIIFVALGKSTLAGIAQEPIEPLTSAEKRRWSVIVAGGAVIVVLGALAFIFTGMLNVDIIGNALFVVCLAIALALFLFIVKDKRISKIERSRVLSYIPLFVTATCFFAISEQQASTIPILVKSFINNDLGFFQIPPAWYASVNPLIIIIASPIFAAVWTKLNRRQPSIFIKLVIGIALAGIGFVLLGLPFALFGESTLISPLWVLASLLFITVGELFISPTGLAATTLLSPTIHASKMMGLWFIANALGQGVNTIAVQFFDSAHPGGFYFIYAVFAFAIGAVVWLFGKKLLALAHGVR